MTEKTYMTLQAELEDLEKELVHLQERKPFFRRKKHEREILKKNVAISLKKDKLAYMESDVELEQVRKLREAEKMREKQLEQKLGIDREEERQVERELQRQRVKDRIKKQTRV